MNLFSVPGKVTSFHLLNCYDNSVTFVSTDKVKEYIDEYRTFKTSESIVADYEDYKGFSEQGTCEIDS